MTSPPPPPELRPRYQRGPVCIDVRPELVGLPLGDALAALGWMTHTRSNGVTIRDVAGLRRDPQRVALRPGRTLVLYEVRGRARFVARVLAVRPLGPDERAFVAHIYLACLKMGPSHLRDPTHPFAGVWYDAAVDSAVLTAMLHDPSRGFAPTTLACHIARRNGRTWAARDIELILARADRVQIDRLPEAARDRVLVAPPPPPDGDDPTSVDELLNRIWPGTTAGGQTTAARNRQILSLRLGLEGEPRTYAAVARAFDLSLEMIRYIVNRMCSRALWQPTPFAREFYTRYGRTPPRPT